MDTCDFIWFAETPVRPVTHGSADVSSSTSSSRDDAGEQQQPPRPAAAVTTPSSSQDGRQQEQEQPLQQYELRPVAVLLPPDGTLLPKGLPTKHFGSDHICLCADFELRALGS